MSITTKTAPGSTGTSVAATRVAAAAMDRAVHEFEALADVLTNARRPAVRVHAGGQLLAAAADAGLWWSAWRYAGNRYTGHRARHLLDEVDRWLRALHRAGQRLGATAPDPASPLAAALREVAAVGHVCTRRTGQGLDSAYLYRHDEVRAQLVAVSDQADRITVALRRAARSRRLDPLPAGQLYRASQDSEEVWLALDAVIRDTRHA